MPNQHQIWFLCLKIFLARIFLSIEDKVYMQDLESGLTMMIRSDIAHSKLISGKKLAALRDWISILVKVSIEPIKHTTLIII